jgi:hypothetical protein
MAWKDAPRKPDGRDRLRAAQNNAETLAVEHGWGRLVSVGETRDHVVFNFESGDQVWYRPKTD